jgi:putative ABC transport system permease protein
MTFRDLADLSVGSLWRIKLRAFLTIAGVAIAIATFVAMLSFAAGNQRWVSNAYTELGLLTRINVFPKDEDTAADSSRVVVLDRAAIRRLSAIPGVRMAYPFVDFEVTASVADTAVTASARAISRDVMREKPFSTLLGGAMFSSDEAKEAVVTREFLKRIAFHDGEKIVGRKIVLSTRVSSIDSALAGVAGDPREEMAKLLGTVSMDSLADPKYRDKIIRREMGERMSGFVSGLLDRKVTVADTLTIIGVGNKIEEYQFPMSPIVVPEGTARQFGSAGIGITSDPADLLAAISSGTIFSRGGAEESRGFPRVTLDTEPQASHEAIVDSVEALGFKAFSFLKEFEQVQRFFVYYYIGLGVIGLIALATASLGIANTMIMSITERRREIGILKSLGASELEIQQAFIVESGTIGAVGAVIGILFGWVGTRIVAAVARVFMQREEMPVFDPFALPVWLILLALAFGIFVSVAAGAYPATRAARVDPVEALRGE